MTYKDIVHRASTRLASLIRWTPTLRSAFFSELLNCTVYFKCENLQFTNSFKLRGAFNKISQIRDPNKIVIASSGGNHGLAVTYAAKKFGMRAIIVLPDFVPAFRAKMIEALGGEVIVFGKTMDDLNSKVAEFTKDPQFVYIHPFDDDEVIAGQGTVAYEFLQEVPELDVIVASMGGGGLISGIAQYAKSFNPHIKIYGTQTIGADAMTKSLAAGEIITIPAITSIATSLGATRVSERTFTIVEKYVDASTAVSDQEAIRDLKLLLEKEKLLVEPASSCNISALRTGAFNITNKKIGIVLCGGNFSLEQLVAYV